MRTTLPFENRLPYFALGLFALLTVGIGEALGSLTSLRGPASFLSVVLVGLSVLLAAGKWRNWSSASFLPC